MTYQMVDTQSGFNAELYWAWEDEVAAGRMTPQQAADGFLSGVFPEAEDEVEDAVSSPALSGPELVLWYRDKIGRKFERADIDSNGELGTQLYDAATNWLLTADLADLAWSDWLTGLAHKIRKHRNQTGLSNGEAKGVLNSMVATLRRKQAPKVVPMSPGLTKAGVAVLQDGLNKVVATSDADDASYDAWCGHVAAEVTKGFFTLVLDDGSHRTFKVGKWNADNRSADPDAKIRWIGLLTGPSNTSDYETVGFQRSNGDVVLIRQYRQSAEVKAMVEMILCGTKADRDGMRKAFAIESGTCAICNRLLTTPESVALGIGPECSKKGWN